MPAQPADSLAATDRIQRFIDAARDDTGFLKGEIGGPLIGWHTPGRHNGDALETLHHNLQLRFPQGGRPFWAVRLWTNLIWQPVYLSVIGVHELAQLPDLGGLSQRVAGPYIDGYRLSVSLPQTGELPDLIALAGTQLRTMSETMLVEVNRLEKLRPLPARRLLADRLLSLLLRLSRRHREIPAATIRLYAERWLAATGLSGQGDLETLMLADGRSVVISARKGCCFDYLVEPGTLCASCPKQPVALRRARQVADIA